MDRAGLVLGILPIAVKLVQFVDKFYNSYKGADAHQYQYAIKLDVQMLQFSKLVRTTKFTDREAIIQQESHNPELAEDLRVRYALACKIIWEIVLLLQRAANLIAPPEKQTEAALSANTTKPGLHRLTSNGTPFSLTPRTPNPKSPIGLANSGDTSTPLSTNSSLSVTPNKIMIGNLLEELKGSSAPKTAVETLGSLLRIEFGEMSDICNHMSKRVKLKAAFTSLSEGPELAQIIDKLSGWNKDLGKTLEKRIDNNATTATVNHIIPHDSSYAIHWKSPAGRKPFRGRDELLNKIRGHLGSPGSHSGRKNVILYGLSGYGKSSTAIEYAYRHSQEYTAILWINSTNIGSLTDSVNSHIDPILNAQVLEESGPNASKPCDFMKIASQLDVGFGDLSTMVTYEILKDTIAKDSIAILKKWLSRDDNNRWLLVMDNCDMRNNELINKLIPNNDQGHIIFTSTGFRPQSLVTSTNTLVEEIQELPVDDRQNILMLSAGPGLIPIGPGFDAASRIAECLKSPLLLNFVDGYLKMNNQKAYVSLPSYWEGLEAATKGFPHSEEKKMGFIFQLSFESLSNTAAMLLETLAFFPVDLVFLKKMLDRSIEHGGMEWMSSSSGGGDQNTGLATTLSDDKKVRILKEQRRGMLKQTLEELCILQFLTSAEESYTIHEVPYEWLKTHGFTNPKYDAAAAEARACNLVIDSLQLTERIRKSDDWIYEREEIRRHITSIYDPDSEPTLTGEDSESTLTGEESATSAGANTFPEPSLQLMANPRAMYAIATVLMHIGKYPAATKLFKHAIKQIQAQCTLDQGDILINSMNSLSVTFREQCKFDSAEKWAEKALKASDTSDPSSNQLQVSRRASAQIAKRNLALAFKLQGKYQDSLTKLEDLLIDLNTSDLPADDISILQAMRHKAEVLCALGKYTEALQEIDRVRNTWKSSDLVHPLILEAREFCVGVYSIQGNYQKALLECEALVKDKTAVFGADHCTVFTAIHEKADAHLAMGELSEAGNEYQRSSNGYKKIFTDNDHPLQLRALQGMATVLNRQGNFREALELYSTIQRGSLRTCPGVEGEFTYLTEVANMQFRMGRYEDALLAYTEAETGQQKALGEDHGFTLTTGLGIANILECQGNYSAALAKLKRVQELGASAWGERHPHNLLAITFSASVLEKQGKYSEAGEYFTKAIKGLSEVLSEEHSFTLTARYGLACVKEHRGNFHEALQDLDFVIEKRKIVAGGYEHPLIFLSKLAQARIYGKQKRYTNAMKSLSEVISVLERKLDLNHPWTLEAHHWAGVFLAKDVALSRSRLIPKKYFSPALSHLKTALEGRKEKLGESHPDTSRTMCAIANIKRKVRKNRYALELLQKAVVDLNKSLGAQHPDTIVAEQQLEKTKKAVGRSIPE